MKLLKWILLCTLAAMPVSFYLHYVFGLDITGQGLAAHAGFWLTLCWFASMLRLADRYPPPTPWRRKKGAAAICSDCGQPRF